MPLDLRTTLTGNMLAGSKIRFDPVGPNHTIRVSEPASLTDASSLPEARRRIIYELLDTLLRRLYPVAHQERIAGPKQAPDIILETFGVGTDLRSAPVEHWRLLMGAVTVARKPAGPDLTLTQLKSDQPHQDAEVIRLALLSGHYHQPVECTDTALKQARTVLDHWYAALRRAGTEAAPVPAQKIDDLAFPTLAALEDDLNTPLAISHLHELAARINKAATADERARMGAGLSAAGHLLGLLALEPDAWFTAGPVTVTDIEARIDRRNAARLVGDFAEADRIRDDLLTAGIVLEDDASGTHWKRSP